MYVGEWWCLPFHSMLGSGRGESNEARTYVEEAEVEDEEDAADLEEAVDGGGPVYVDGEDGGVYLEVVEELREPEGLEEVRLVDHGLLGVLQVVHQLSCSGWCVVGRLRKA